MIDRSTSAQRSKISEEGKRACKDGVHRVNNPYEPGSWKWKRWDEGYVSELED